MRTAGLVGVEDMPRAQANINGRKLVTTTGAANGRGKMRRAAKIDDNQNMIVGVLRAYGIRVLSLAAVGNGAPDLLVYNPRTTELLLLEVKDGSKPPSRRKLRPKQETFREQWPVAVVTNENEALKAVGIN